MKTILKMLLYAVIGFAAGYLTLELLYGRNIGGTLDVVYFWLSIVMIIIIISLLLYAFIRRRNLISLTKDKNRNMTDDEFDAYSYNSFNVITVMTSVSLILSFMSLAIQTMAAENPWLIVLTVILVFISLYMSIRASALINIVYPDRNLPEPGEKKYNQKLLAATDEGELFVMAKALYTSGALTSALLFFAMILMIFYSIITEESQIFSIILLGLIMIINQLKYSYEIREK